jgi:hypothetical protein
VTRTRTFRAVLGAALLLAAGAACATTSPRSPELEAELESFYADWEAEVEAEIRALDEGGRSQLMAVWPRAEFEGATNDVLTVLEEEAELQPVVRRLRRFLQSRPSARVTSELQTQSGDHGLWKILVDTINAELGRPSSTAALTAL